MRWAWGRIGTTIWRNSGGDFGPWIDGYTTPKPGRYHAGLRAGELSQTGRVTVLLLRSVADRGGYDEADFARRLDEDLLPRLDGTPKAGPGGYTNQDMRDVYRFRGAGGPLLGRMRQPGGHPPRRRNGCPCWRRGTPGDPAGGAAAMAANCLLTQNDGLTVSLSVAFGCVLSALIRGEPMDGTISDKLMDLVHDGALPFGHVTAPGNRPPGSDGQAFTAIPGGHFSSPDGVLLPGYCAEAAHDPAIRIEPAWKVCGLYGLPCAIYGPLPAAYYLAARFAGGVRGPGAARAQRRRPEPQPRRADRGARRGAGGPERDSAGALWTDWRMGRSWRNWPGD